MKAPKLQSMMLSFVCPQICITSKCYLYWGGNPYDSHCYHPTQNMLQIKEYQTPSHFKYDIIFV